MRQLRVLHVVSALHGTETWLLRLPLYIDSTMHLACYQTSGMVVPRGQIPDYGLEVISGPSDKRHSRWARLVAFGKFLQGYEPDVIHAHLEYITAIAVVARNLFRCPAPVIAHFHNTPRLKRHSPLYWLQRYAEPRADLVLCASEYVRRTHIAYYGVPEEKTATVYLGVCLDQFDELLAQSHAPNGKPRASDETRLVFIGRLVRLKGVDLLLKVMAELVKSTPASLVVVGDGPERPSLECAAREYQIADHVKFLGAQSHSAIPAILRGCDIYVHPARHEGLGLAMVEASAAGLPVVATTVEGIPEAVEDGVSGLLVPPDDAQEFLQAVQDLVGSPRKRKEMGLAGRRIVEQRFDMSRGGHEFAKLYKRVLNDRSAC